MILKDVEPFEAYDCKTGGCGYEGESFDAYVNGMQRVLEDLDSAPEIDPESLPVVKQLRAELEKANKERDAAVNDLRECAIEDYAECIYCSRRNKDTLCQNCMNGSNWEWRGVKEG